MQDMVLNIIVLVRKCTFAGIDKIVGKSQLVSLVHNFINSGIWFHQYWYTIFSIPVYLTADFPDPQIPHDEQQHHHVVHDTEMGNIIADMVDFINEQSNDEWAAATIAEEDAEITPAQTPASATA